MNRCFYRAMPFAIALAASFWNAGAYAQTAQIDHEAVPAQTPRPLSRRDVYNQLVQAQKDGSLARADSIYYGTYWGWEEPFARRSSAAGE